MKDSRYPRAVAAEAQKDFRPENDDGIFSLEHRFDESVHDSDVHACRFCRACYF